MDIFDNRSASPMLIAEMQEPFDSPDYIYELKLDGERCLAYLDKDGITLQNKRKLLLNPRFPELSSINKSVKTRCILDGEITVLVDGKPDFSQVQRRALMSNKFKIQLLADKYPASFTAFDILYYKDGPVIDMPLMERKALLQKVIKAENDRLAISRYIEEQGKTLYDAAAKQDLEGVVAKRKDSLYSMGVRTKDWIKFKRLLDDDFVVLGYIQKGNGVVSVILGQYRDGELIYKGHATTGMSNVDFKIISNIERTQPPFIPPKGHDKAIWIKPYLVCIVSWMPRKNGALNQPIYKGLRDDKDPIDCKEKKPG